MSISGQNLSIVIVSLKSESVIHQCIKSINHNIPIIVVENSDNQIFKQELEAKYKNLKCILSNSNLGMGAGNNIGIKHAKTEYVYLLNPDVTLEENTLEKIFFESKKIKNFSILSPINSDPKYPNYNRIKKKESESMEPFKVNYIDGFSMLINKKNFNNDIFFDENFFLYLENNDLCLRVRKSGGSIFILPSVQINHGGAKTVNVKYKDQIELSRNWHWIWSKFYFNKKHFGFFKAIIECLPTYISSVMKYLFYFIVNNNFKKKIYFNRASGFYNALLGKSSWYRPKIDN